MPCHRCHGFLLPDHPAIFYASAALSILDDEIPLAAWRCVNCGAYTDAVIRRNQARQRAERWLLAEADALVTQVAT